MRATRESVLAIVPRLLPCAYGGYLAVSPDEAPIGIGVYHRGNADDAANAFSAELQAWANLLAAETPVPEKA